MKVFGQLAIQVTAGSALAGAVASPPGVCPGSGIMFAVVSAVWAGASAARYVTGSSQVDIDTEGGGED